MKKLNTKNTSWNLKPLFKSDNDPAIEREYKKVRRAVEAFAKKWSGRSDYLKSASVLKRALDEYKKLDKDYGLDGKVGYYFDLRSTQDEQDPKIKAKINKNSAFAAEIGNKLSFFDLRLAKVPKAMQKKFLVNKSLAYYHHFLEGIFLRARYQLSEAEEKIMRLKAPMAENNWVRMVSDFLSREERVILAENGKKERKTFAEVANLLISKKKKVRDGAVKAFNSMLANNVDVAEAEFNSVLQNKKVNDELRGMARPDLARFLADDIDAKTVDVLVEEVSKNFGIVKRYYKLKAKLLGQKKLAYHERNVEYGKIDKKYSFTNSANLVHKVLYGLDKEFADIFAEYLNNGQIDVFPKKGKSSGAFCAHGLVIHPIYILLNHTNTLNDVTILAHELGHGINNELMKKQGATYFGITLATAEVASTFFEDFVLDKVLEGANNELKLSIMMTKLNGDISKIFRQITSVLFERELHKTFREKGYLSKEEIGKLFTKHMSAYMGSYVEQSPGSQNWWVYWSHLRKFFYNYSYSNGLLISKALQSLVKEDPKFIEKVKEFLSAGKSQSPRQIFKNMGIDITKKSFWQKGIREVEQLLKDTEKLAKKMGKI